MPMVRSDVEVSAFNGVSKIISFKEFLPAFLFHVTPEEKFLRVDRSLKSRDYNNTRIIEMGTGFNSILLSDVVLCCWPSGHPLFFVGVPSALSR